jgi:hypothetical protein
VQLLLVRGQPRPRLDQRHVHMSWARSAGRLLGTRSRPPRVRAGVLEGPGFGKRPAEVEDGQAARGIRPRGMPPQRYRVAPHRDLSLVSGETARIEGYATAARRRAQRGGPSARPPGPGHRGPGSTAQLPPAGGRRVRRELRPVGNTPEAGSSVTRWTTQVVSAAAARAQHVAVRPTAAGPSGRPRSSGR